MLDVKVDKACHRWNQDGHVSCFRRWRVLACYYNTRAMCTWFQKYSGVVANASTADCVGSGARSDAATAQHTPARRSRHLRPPLQVIWWHAPESALSRYLPPVYCEIYRRLWCDVIKELEHGDRVFPRFSRISTTFHYLLLGVFFVLRVVISWHDPEYCCDVSFEDNCCGLSILSRILNFVKPGTSYLAHSVVWFRGIHFEGHLLLQIDDCPNVIHLAAFLNNVSQCWKIW